MPKEINREKMPSKKKTRTKFDRRIFSKLVGGDQMEILGQVESRQGSFITIKTYVQGEHPHLGKKIIGLNGIETEITAYYIKPLVTFKVIKALPEKSTEDEAA